MRWYKPLHGFEGHTAENRKNSDSTYNGWSFVDSAYNAVKNRKVVQVFTTGNRDFANPFYRPLYPYFNPEAEKNWVAVAGMKQGDNGTYELYATFNEAGTAKWWTVAAPGSGIYSSKVDVQTDEPTWGNSSGTSMAAPHVTGALAVLMSRYDQMDATQVRDVMLTTASHRNDDGSIFKGWTAKEGEVDVRYGWGMPDLDKGMYGPAQFLGDFKYNMRDKDSLDVWSNDISQTALNQRETEEKAWAVAAQKWLDGKTLTSDETALIGELTLESADKIIGIEDSTISEEKAKEWRKAYFEKRLEAIKARGEYNGSLEKSGLGTLVMTGDNSYQGDTTVMGGMLLAFAESIGNDKVTVENGGTFGVLSGYDDNFTMRGYLESEEAQAGKLNVVVKEGGTLYVDGASTVKVNSVEFQGQQKNVTVGLQGSSRMNLVNAYHAEPTVAHSGGVSGSFETATGNNVFEGVTTGNVKTDSIFFDVASATGSGNKLEVTMTKKDGVAFDTFAVTKEQKVIAAAIEQSYNNFAGSILAMNDGEKITEMYAGLTDDMYASARNALVVNSTMVTRSVIDQARGMGQGRSAEFNEGRSRVWAAGIGTWGTADGASNDVDVDFTAGLIGGEFVANDALKVGAFFGYGQTDYDGKFGKIDADDLHFGVYGLTDVGPVSVTFGLAYTQEDRDSTHELLGVGNKHSEDASVLQGFAEATYNVELGAAKLQPYFGFTYARVDVDGFTETNGVESFKTKDQKDDLQITTLGVRTTVPFSMGSVPVAFKADAGWSHYFGDTEGVTQLQMGAGGAYADITSGELKNQFNLGLGLAAQLGQNATVGLSYTGSIGSDASSHGVIANVRFAF